MPMALLVSSFSAIAVEGYGNRDSMLLTHQIRIRTRWWEEEEKAICTTKKTKKYGRSCGRTAPTDSISTSTSSSTIAVAVAVAAGLPVTAQWMKRQYSGCGRKSAYTYPRVCCVSTHLDMYILDLSLVGPPPRHGRQTDRLPNYRFC